MKLEVGMYCKTRLGDVVRMLGMNNGRREATRLRDGHIGLVSAEHATPLAHKERWTALIEKWKQLPPTADFQVGDVVRVMNRGTFCGSVAAGDTGSISAIDARTSEITVMFADLQQYTDGSNIKKVNPDDLFRSFCK